MCAELLRDPRSVNPCTAATLLFDSKLAAAPMILEMFMRKMVPDPPLDTTQFLQDTLVQSSEYVLCALSVARQSVQLKPTAHSSIVMQAVIHEMEAVQGLVESALMQLQMRSHLPTEPHTLH
ncbi:conserved protein of unknown function [Pseudomonas putida KT2440]|uniref:Uncharacterized protein n=2 Tax=Pseudomonas putida group TaxID=136845 RepID=Q88NG5_PSEPK|nr:conserved protein of unknown function [Pseudomonas putida KT2440]